MTKLIKPRQQWIGSENTAAAPLFRRKFICARPLKKAELLISGLGCHEAWINGARVSDHIMDPAQTDYELRVLYVRHNVTSMLHKGANAIGVILGNGWYNQNRVWGEKGLSYGQPRLMAELHLTYEDGDTVEVIRADNSWRCASGPITDNNLYAGESYDARLEIDGWSMPGFDDASWKSAVSMEPPGGELQQETMPPMRCIEELLPTAVKETKPGVYVVDFSQNFSGWARIQFQAPSGTEITLRFAETVFADGNVDTASTGVFATHVEQIDRYICKGSGTEIWEPRFAYHGFRYIEVTGWPGRLLPEQIRGIVVHNDLPAAGSFESSDERLNQLHRLALWTHRSNMHGLPEDCPAREKCGWLGDANLVAEYSLWNYDAKSFWEKYLDDIETTRTFNDGIPGNVAPGKRCSRNAAQPDWAAAFIMLPWYLYLHSGDLNVIRKHWAGMTQLMTYLSQAASQLDSPPAQGRGDLNKAVSRWIVPGGHGDYFDPGTDKIVQHTPQTLTTTMWFCHCADVMASMAAALDEETDEATYREWQGNIAAALRDNFYDHEAGSFGSQAADTLALAFNVLPHEEDRILNALVNDIRDRDMHMNVGVMGVRFILEVLTQRGHGDIALAMMHQNSYPSFGHLIECGATTLWECWGEDGHNETHGARSLNHPFMGGYDNWFFNTLAGIRPDPKAAGFTHFYLKPISITGLQWVRCHHNCPHGRIESSWKFETASFVWDIRIPKGTTATATMPLTGQTLKLDAGEHRISSDTNHTF